MFTTPRRRAVAVVLALLVAAVLLSSCCYCTSGRRYRPFRWPKVSIVMPRIVR